MTLLKYRSVAHCSIVLVATVVLAGPKDAARGAVNIIPGDMNGDTVVNIFDLFAWDERKFDPDPKAIQRDVADLMVFGDVYNPSTTASLVPQVTYDAESGALTLIAQGAPIYAFKLPIHTGGILPFNGDLPDQWKVVSAFGALQGYDSSFADILGESNALDQLLGPTDIAQLTPGLTSGDIGEFFYDTAAGLSASVPVQIVGEPASVPAPSSLSMMLCCVCSAAFYAKITCRRVDRRLARNN